MARVRKSAASDRPLFIPLCGKWYDAFAAGTKDTEYRAYGPRWNERTCPRGRKVTLSRGYGKAHRMVRVVALFQRLPRHLAPIEAKTIYPSARYFAAIKLQ